MSDEINELQRQIAELEDKIERRSLQLLKEQLSARQRDEEPEEPVTAQKSAKPAPPPEPPAPRPAAKSESQALQYACEDIARKYGIDPTDSKAVLRAMNRAFGRDGSGW